VPLRKRAAFNKYTEMNALERLREVFGAWNIFAQDIIGFKERRLVRLAKKCLAAMFQRCYNKHLARKKYEQSLQLLQFKALIALRRNADR